MNFRTKRYTLSDDQIAVILIAMEKAVDAGQLHDSWFKSIASKLEVSEGLTSRLTRRSVEA